MLLRRMDTLSGEATLFESFLYFLKWVFPERKVDPYPERKIDTEKQTGRQKLCPFETGGNSLAKTKIKTAC